MTFNRRIAGACILLSLLPCQIYSADTPVHDCDHLAANPNDINKVVPGVDWEMLVTAPAVEACEKAVKDYPDTVRFTYQYARALHKAGDVEKSADLYKKAANEGYARAQFAFGYMFIIGDVIERDFDKAFKWFRKSADQGDPDAQFRIGVMYSAGYGVSKDEAEAVKWLRKAAEQAQPGAQFMIGIRYIAGQIDLKNYKEAEKWIRLSADQGYPEAQYMLGIMYANGEGVKKDQSIAIEWYRKAAEQGHAESMHELGRMYSAGRGVNESVVQAYAWVSLSAARKHMDSRQILAYLAESMTNEQIAEAQKIAWVWEKEHADSLAPSDYKSLSGYVIIDRTNPAYTVFTGIPKDTSEKRLDELTSEISANKNMQMMNWTGFYNSINKLAHVTIVKHEYLQYGVIDGIACLVGKSPETPWGLTWNGGIALTQNDYRQAKKSYQLHQEDPKKYNQRGIPDPRGDPINPAGHLPAFGCY